MKKIKVPLVVAGFLMLMFVVLSSAIPFLVGQSYEQSYAENTARKIASNLQNADIYAIDVEKMLQLPHFNGKTPSRGFGSQMFIELEKLGDIGWPTIVDKVKITFVYGDGSSHIYRYNTQFMFGRV